MAMGRPKIEIDWAKLEKICQYKVTLEDAAYLAGCRPRTLEEKIRNKYDLTFREFREQRMSVTRLNLFSKQVEVALAGNTAMLIWLGKNLLGQSDKQEIKETSDSPKLYLNLGGTNESTGQTISSEPRKEPSAVQTEDSSGDV